VEIEELSGTIEPSQEGLMAEIEVDFELFF